MLTQSGDQLNYYCTKSEDDLQNFNSKLSDYEHNTSQLKMQLSEKESGLQSLSHKLNVRDAEIKELKEKLNLLKNNELDSVKVVKLNYLNLNQRNKQKRLRKWWNLTLTLKSLTSRKTNSQILLKRTQWYFSQLAKKDVSESNNKNRGIKNFPTTIAPPCLVPR